MCLSVLFSSCSRNPIPIDTSTSAVSTTISETNNTETTVPFLTKINVDNLVTRKYETITEISSNKQKVFFDYEYRYEPSDKYIICYSNPENSENFYHNKNKYGIADTKENIIVSPQFDYIVQWDEDRYYVENFISEEDSDVALINLKGEFIIPYCAGIFSVRGAFNDEVYYGMWIGDGKFYFVDDSGNKVYDNCFENYFGRHINRGDNEWYGIYDGKLYVFDYRLNIKEIIDETPVVKENFYTKNNLEYCVSVCFKNNKTYCGIINKTTGKKIVPCKYDEITRFANDRILASSDNEEPVITSGGTTHYGNTIAIYDFHGNVLCPEGEYCNIEIYDAKFNSDYGEKTYRSFEAVGVASAYNPNGDRIYGSYYEWLIDKNGTKISDKYYNVYGQIWESHDERIYTADRGDRVFYLNKYGKVVGTIGQ